MTIWPRKSVILVADDEVHVRNLIRAVLKTNYDVLVAADGGEALTLSRACLGPVDFLLTDVDMPEMDGVELHRLLRIERPKMKVLFTSGRPPHSGIGESPQLPFLAKPFSADALRKAVRMVVESSPQPKAILVVDSHIPRRDRTSRILSEHGYAVSTASSAEEAEAISDSAARIDLIVSAVNMSGDSGVHLADHVDASLRNISTLLISHAGLTELNQIPGFAGQPQFLENPFTPELLLERVRALLDKQQDEDDSRS